MKVSYLICLCIISLLLPRVLTAQTITLVNQSATSSLRGLSVVDNNIAWVSGSKGTVGVTIDAGKTWNWPVVKGFEKADFRDIEAFSDKEAVIVSSGTPALILKTIDGGINWKLCYQNNDKAYFLDALEFNGTKHGAVLGDPINNKFLILETFDAGDTWALAKTQPLALPDEAAFAASGTCFRRTKNTFSLVTGGSNARLVTLDKNVKNNPVAVNIPILHGKGSQGAFSIAYGNKKTIIVGGDYSKDNRIDSVATYSINSKPALAIQQPAGFQSCVEYLNDDIFIATGTPGSNITSDGGKTWRKIDVTSYNVCRKAKRGNLILFAGDRGRIGIFKL
ncbi:WD40/YVTN/BNR-like repeat-containing protein [Mucilaginibacter glaciei]|uniref:Oxidoreductase n=1 Tax=Mucilaginibacter glaciei TaxID=2772109 RepID=A0A926NSP8_9SPHI|nr:YCF48-related protein [Mucilaginibacter glaciei]MBD1394623.1 oxidoreductase [Mucilaginibacter glaciei]